MSWGGAVGASPTLGERSKMPNLTDEQKKKYLEAPHKCPFCGSTEIEAGDSDDVGNQYVEEVACPDCKEKWSDIYTLTDVMVV